MSETGAAGAPDLSIIIPAYNEARRLPASFARLYDFLRSQPYLTEVIVVDDGSDDSTAAVVRAWMGRWHALNLVKIPHSGKGAAVRAGALAAKGAWILLADADFSMPVEEIARFAPAERPECDVLIGSREAIGARRVGEPGYRHLMGRVYNRLTQTLVMPGILDTQCGFKRFRREQALDLFFHQTVAGWGFDIELLSIARLRGYHVGETPVTWYYKPGSKVRPLRDTLSMTRDVVSIWRNTRQKRYERRIIAHPSFAAVAPVTPASHSLADAAQAGE